MAKRRLYPRRGVVTRAWVVARHRKYAAETVPPSFLEGSVTLDDAAPTGGMSTQPEAVLSGSVTLGDALASGSLGAQSSLTGEIALDDAATSGALYSEVSLGGTVRLDDAAPSGSLSTQQSTMSGEVSLDDMAPGGSMGRPGSYRYGTQLVPGAYHYGGSGLGVPGSSVPSEGTSGPSLLFGDITLPAEADDEFRTVITVPPVGLTLWFVNEDGSFLAEGPDGVYTGTREGFKNGVSYGAATFTLRFGEPTLLGTVALDDVAPSGTMVGATEQSLVWEGFVLESGLTPGAMLRIVLAAVAGRTDGVGTNTERYFSVDGSKPRITATFDGTGNRTTIVLDGTP